MNRDLEESLQELGPEYRAVVARLRDATGDSRGRETRDGRRALTSYVLGLKSYLTAASLLVLLSLSIFFINSNPQTLKTSNPQTFPREYCASVDEMIAAQNADGSWANDFLTRRNAEALKLCGDPAAKIAYKKAMRNLRVRGIL